MRLELCMEASESVESLRRRGRVLAYRLARGELVVVDGEDPVAVYVLDGYRVAPGMAAGIVPW
jgi:hypothetical protein